MPSPLWTTGSLQQSCRFSIYTYNLHTCVLFAYVTVPRVCTSVRSRISQNATSTHFAYSAICYPGYLNWNLTILSLYGGNTAWQKHWGTTKSSCYPEFGGCPLLWGPVIIANDFCARGTVASTIENELAIGCICYRWFHCTKICYTKVVMDAV